MQVSVSVFLEVNTSSDYKKEYDNSSMEQAYIKTQLPKQAKNGRIEKSKY